MIHDLYINALRIHNTLFINDLDEIKLICKFKLSCKFNFLYITYSTNIYDLLCKF